MADIHQEIHRVFGVSRSRARGHRPILCREPRERLTEVFSAVGYSTGAEIGVKAGDYSISLCKGVPGLHLYCVDIWGLVGDRYRSRRQGHLRQAKSKLEGHHVTFMEARSLDAVREFKDGSLDFAYIDAAHDFDNAVQDIIQWNAKVKRGGMIAVHDYYQHRGGVVPAVDAYVNCHRIDPWYVTYELMPTAFWVKP